MFKKLQRIACLVLFLMLAEFVYFTSGSIAYLILVKHVYHIDFCLPEKNVRIFYLLYPCISMNSIT